jgi:hypothetical protein
MQGNAAEDWVAWNTARYQKRFKVNIDFQSRQKNAVGVADATKMLESFFDKKLRKNNRVQDKEPAVPLQSDLRL